MANYPCRNCVYFNACGETTRTAPCDGRRTKTEQKKEKQKAENLSLMERLLNAGIHLDELDHHESDLYVPVSPISTSVIEKWLEDNGWSKDLINDKFMIDQFTDLITGKRMYDVAFQYIPFWNNRKEASV